MTTVTVETLASLIAQMEAKRKETEGHSVSTTSDDRIDHDEFVNFGSGQLSAFTQEEFLKKRKKKDSAFKAQQTFCK